MSRYFFHLHEPDGSSLDEEGGDYPDIDHAVAAAVDGARDVMAADIRAGKLDLDCRIEIVDGSGALVREMSFREVVAISGL